MEREAQCAAYLQLLIVVSVAAGTDVLVSGAFTFLDAAKAGRVHAALHVVSLVYEIGILTGTVLLQQHGSQAKLGPRVAGGKGGRADLFLARSSSFNLVTFALNMVGLSAIITGGGAMRAAHPDCPVDNFFTPPCHRRWPDIGDGAGASLNALIAGECRQHRVRGLPSVDTDVTRLECAAARRIWGAIFRRVCKMLMRRPPM